MKRIISLVLIVLIFITNINFNLMSTFANEESNNKIVFINANVNGIPRNLPAIQNESGNLFLSGKTLSEITVYHNEAKEMFFQHDNATDSIKYREIIINKELKVANIVIYAFGLTNITKAVKLPDIIKCNNEWYFPLAEMLPLLNANAIVEDNCLYVENVKYSLSNILPEFQVMDYMYNSYNENDLGITSSEKLLSAYSYLYNTVMNFDLKRLTFTGRYLGKVDSYEEIFTNYLADGEAYYEALKDEDDYALPLIDYLQNDESDRLSTLIDGMKPAKEILDSYSQNKNLTSNDYKSISSMAKIAEISDFTIDIYSIAAIYTDHVNDHYQMLKSIYKIGDIDNASFFKTVSDPSDVAANRIYATYSEDKVNMITGIVCQQTEKTLAGELQDIILKQIAEKKKLGNGFLWSQLATCVAREFFISTDFYVHKVASKCENLGYYNRLMEQGYSQYSNYCTKNNPISHDNIENTRLSAIFTLLSSRSIYEALCEADKAINNNGTFYQRKIDSINEMLKKFYLAKNCCLTDTEEYIDQRINDLNQKIANLELLDSEPDYFSLESQLEGIDIETLQMYARYFYSHYNEENCSVFLTDFTHDGIKEMTIVDRKEDYNHDITIYQLNNNTIEIIHQSFTGHSHVGWCGLSWIVLDDQDYLIEYAPYVYQGISSYVGTVFYYDKSTFEKIVYDNAEITNCVVDEQDPRFDKKLVNDLETIFEEFLEKYLNTSLTLSNESRINPNEYDISANNEYTTSEASKLFYGIDISYDESLTNFKCQIGKVTISDGVLNLRRIPCTDDIIDDGLYSGKENIIIQLSKDTEVIILEKWIPSSIYDYNWNNHDEWFLIDYNGIYGYVNADYITLTENQTQLTENQLIEIARSRHMEGSWVLAYEFSKLIEIDSNAGYIDNIYSIAKNITTKQQAIDIIHSLFDSNYDSEIKLYENIDNRFIEKNGILGVNQDLEKGYYPYTSSEISINKIRDNEIIFDITLFWKESKWEHMRGQTKNEQFSIIYEEGTWKCGKI